MKRRWLSGVFGVTMLLGAVGLVGCGGGGDDTVPIPISGTNLNADGTTNTGNTNTGTNTGGTTNTGPVDRARAATVSKQAVGGIRGVATRLREDPTGGTAGRTRTVIRAIQSGKATRQAGAWEFDEEQGLYSRFNFVSSSGNTAIFRIEYAVNANGSDPAGFIEYQYPANATDPNIPYPQTYYIIANVTKGNFPVIGEATYVLEGPARGRYTYNYRNPATGEVQSGSFRFDESGQYYESLAFSDEGINYDVSNVVRQSNGDIEADVSTSGVTGRALVRVDNSGILRIPSLEGDVVSDWDKDGKGKIQYPDGSVEEVPDFDAL